MEDDSMKKIILIVLGWIVLSCAVNAASFDCAKAGTKVEHMICDDPDISKMDDERSSYNTRGQSELFLAR
jgi:uncharacterized protein